MPARSVERQVMRRNQLPVLAALSICVVAQAGLAAAPVVDGQYIEARVSRLPGGRQFVNPDTQLRGDHAVLGWAIRQGVWNEVRLDGLFLALLVDSSGPLSRDVETSQQGRPEGLDASGRPEGIVRSVLYVDERASKKQEKALIDLAGELSPRYVKAVVKIRRARLSLKKDGPSLRLTVGRSIDLKLEISEEHDDRCHSICGGRERKTRCLSRHTEAACAKSTASIYRMPGLEVRWTDLERRATLVGRFAL